MASTAISSAPASPPLPSNNRNLVDGLTCAWVVALAVCLELGLIVAPRDHAFRATDASISYPFVAENNVSVSWRTLTAYSLAAPLGTIVLVDGLVRRTRAERTMKRLIAYVFGAAAVLLACAVIQLASSVLTPDYVSRCNPDPSSIPLSGLLDESSCRGDHGQVRRGRMSFPNTVAAISAYAMIIEALYVRNHVYVSEAKRRLRGPP
jgi:hypothetical protein